MNLNKVIDVSKDEQTDDLKKQVYSLIRQFVYKNQVHYHPHFKGDRDDLVSDLFTEFLTDKTHRNGEVFSELDRFDPKKMGGDKAYNRLASYVKNFVVKSLIDAERTDKREVNYAEKYDEETGTPTVDFLVNLIDDPTVDLSEFEFTDELLSSMKRRISKLDASSRKVFLDYYDEVKNVIPKNFREAFDKII